MAAVSFLRCALLLVLAAAALAGAHARRATIGEVLRDRVLGGCNCDSIPEKTFKKIKQSAAQTCWAASTAMVLNWKEGVDTYTEQTAAEKLGLTQRYNDRVAVPPNEIPNLVAALEMNDLKMSVPPPQMCELIRKHGPMIGGIFASVPNAERDPSVPAHMIVVLGLSGECHPSGKGTRVTYVDPATGKAKAEPFMDFYKRSETWQRAYTQAVSAICVRDNVPFETCQAYMQPLSFAHFRAERPSTQPSQQQ